MGSKAKARSDRAAGPEQDLVDDIARAMQNRPLMRRLANLEAGFPASPGVPQAHAPLPPAAPVPDAAPGPSFEQDPLEAIRRRLEDAEVGWAETPASAEWLNKAQRERTRTHLRNALAWIVTLAIGGAIIAATALMLKA